MRVTLFVSLIVWAGLVASAAAAVAASTQDYPTRPIRMVTSGVGGGNDFAVRLITPGLAAALGQQMIVDNRPSVAISAELVSHSAPDGYVLLLAGSPLWIGPLMEKTQYDPIRDLAPITLALMAPNIIVAHPSLPVKSVKELIALAKSKPGALNYASSAAGGTTHLAAELFNSMAGVNIVRINYRSSGPAIVSLVSGEVQLMFATSGSVSAHIKSGRLRALAVTSAQPSALFPDLPTVAASGVPGYEATSPFGIFAPAKTPASIINRLNQEIVLVLGVTDVKQRFLAAGVEIVGSSPGQLSAAIRSEMSKLGKVIMDAGIRAE